ncbi:protein of unknown function DUF34 [Coriobacterium glomerans PW2]|uniref:GTP cyclohydrolase 1 type 2 homolog n=1 Tax=Coriobacterium glomerans (strain ATCC 49209 / DSM 20642 / JCM 10262 / PW2) TaxID=700015 RepID=F2N9J6_CORGP|nr:Nif3-like dinuclear metal center hexameric protein [Coriobacterium glomerans]AEB07025.1 protein of unknown function DUF34 [Coriobacterium glomerans PW2]
MRVSELERSLFECYPRSVAEPWDHVGLSVGRPDEELGVACVALDASPRNVGRAHELGAGVLVTHHPVYISAPASFVPECAAAPQGAAAVFTAAELGVSVISMHTNLDRSPDARAILPELLGVGAQTSLEYPSQPDRAGIGAIAKTAPERLGDLARRVARVFSTEPRVWGDPACEIAKLAFVPGALGDLGGAAIDVGADVLITGEAGYHVCQDLAACGCSVILLGHDRSEEPFVDVLARRLIRIGLSGDAVKIIRSSAQWWTISKGDLL